jgi:hypothetical protein
MPKKYTVELISDLKNFKSSNNEDYLPYSLFNFEYIRSFLYQGIVNIYTNFENNDLEYPLSEDINKFQIQKDRFIYILEEWIKIKEKQPTFIILKISDTEIIFEEDYREEIAIDKSKLTIKEESIENMFNLKTKDDLFYGGFHLISENNKDLKLSNKVNDASEVISVDINNEKDLTFNHVSFPENYNKEDILNKINEKSGRPLYAIKYDKNKNEKLFDYYAAISKDNIKNIVAIRVISNQKNEIVACYPIFEEMA